GGVELGRSLDQSQDSGGFQIIQINEAGKAARQSAQNMAHALQMFHDQKVAKLLLRHVLIGFDSRVHACVDPVMSGAEYSFTLEAGAGLSAFLSLAGS